MSEYSIVNVNNIVGDESYWTYNMGHKKTFYCFKVLFILFSIESKVPPEFLCLLLLTAQHALLINSQTSLIYVQTPN